MPASEMTVPVQRSHPGRSWPSHALIKLTVIGVQPKISALLATDVRATPPRNRIW